MEPVPTEADAKRAMRKALTKAAMKDAKDIVSMARIASIRSLHYLESVVSNPQERTDARVNAAGKILALGWGSAPTRIQGQLDLNVTETKVITPDMVRQAALRLVSQRAEDAA